MLSFERKKTKNKLTVIISGSAVFEQADAVKDLFASLLQEKKICFDFEKLESVDLIFIQLFAAFTSSRDRSGTLEGVELSRVGNAFGEAVVYFGFSAHTLIKKFL